MVNAAPEAVPLGLRTEMTFVGADVTTRALFAPSEPDAVATQHGRHAEAACPQGHALESPAQAHQP